MSDTQQVGSTDDVEGHSLKAFGVPTSTDAAESAPVDGADVQGHQFKYGAVPDQDADPGEDVEGHSASGRF